MVFIIPKFEKIFKDFNMKLPWLTQALMDTSRWFANYWYVLPLFPLSWWLMIKLIRLNKTGNYAVDRVYLWIPIIGPLIEKTVVARTMRTLGTLVSSGVPILEALSIVRETCTNAVFERMYQRVYESIREGDTIAQPLKESRTRELLIAFAIFAIGLVFAYILADRYVKPIHAVADAAQNIAARGLEPR